MRLLFIFLFVCLFYCCLATTDTIFGAVAKDDVKKIKTILKKHPDQLDQKGNGGQTPLMFAVLGFDGIRKYRLHPWNTHLHTLHPDTPLRR